MKRVAIVMTGFLLLSIQIVKAQGKYFTKTGKISFFSSTSMENIEAINRSGVCLLDTKTGDLQFAVQLKGFEFKKALMQEHFNSDYVESDKFPKSEFKGQITNNSSVTYGIDGNYNVSVKGKLTIHGITKDIETSGMVTIKDGKPILNATFNILIADYQISVPKLYQDNISKSIKITVNASLESLK
jgi:hypothetical protein